MLPSPQPCAVPIRRWHWRRELGGGLTMAQTWKAVISGTAFILTALVPSSLAQAPTLQEQLAAQYKPVKMGSAPPGFLPFEWPAACPSPPPSIRWCPTPSSPAGAGAHTARALGRAGKAG